MDNFKECINGNGLAVLGHEHDMWSRNRSLEGIVTNRLNIQGGNTLEGWCQGREPGTCRSRHHGCTQIQSNSGPNQSLPSPIHH